MRRVALALAVSLSTIAGGLSAQEQAREAGPSQSAVARALLSDDWQVTADALNDALGIPLGDRGPELRGALIELLERVGRSEPNAPTYERAAEYGDVLLHAVMALEDPAAIPALIYSPTFGAGVSTALAEFGLAALPETLKAATSPDPPWAVGNALMTLPIMVEVWGGAGALPDFARRQMTEVAMIYLNGIGEVYDAVANTSSWHVGVEIELAMNLAILLEDADLRARVEEIATDPSVVEELQVTWEFAPRSVREYAAGLLAGEPPLPRPRAWRRPF